MTKTEILDRLIAIHFSIDNNAIGCARQRLAALRLDLLNDITAEQAAATDPAEPPQPAPSDTSLDMLRRIDALERANAIVVEERLRIDREIKGLAGQVIALLETEMKAKPEPPKVRRVRCVDNAQHEDVLTVGKLYDVAGWYCIINVGIIWVVNDAGRREGYRADRFEEVAE